jgi:pimeloyl-ACP methyl ester carboxylesterase
MLSLALALPFVLGATEASAHGDKNKRRPLVLEEQGTFYVGGTVEFRTPNSTINVADPRSLPGNIAVNSAYVEYQIPEDKDHKYPIVFMHGGGHTGEFWRTTPDGRQGWFTSFTRRGFAVYAVDGANRGRAGWNPTARIQATLGLAPASAMEPVNVYSEQSAWTAFRWGPSYGVPYPNTQFPLEAKDAYLRQIQPAYRDTAANPNLAANIGALIDRIGPCILVGWSTGGTNVLAGAASTPERVKKVKGIIAIEGGNATSAPVDQIAKIPLLYLTGDNTSPDGAHAYAAQLRGLGGDATSVWLPDIGMFGNGHTLALERNNEKIADFVEGWIKKHVEKKHR